MLAHWTNNIFIHLEWNGASSFFDELLEIPVIVLPTVRFVGILTQNLYSNRDLQYNEFRTIKILTYQYLVPLVSLVGLKHIPILAHLI